MGITERLANMSIPEVLIIMAVLFGLRYVLLRRKTPFTKSLAETAESLAVALGLVFLLIRPFIVQAFFIPSESMLPGLRVHDHILVNKFIYRFKEPQLGDVIVFRAPIEATPPLLREILDEADNRGLTGKERQEFIRKQARRVEKDFIKRVIGVPGDEVRITPGYVLVDGDRYERDDLRNVLSEAMTGGKIKLVDGKALVDMKVVKPDEIAEAVGRSGAKVKIVPGKVYINGKPINEPYTAEDPGMPYPLEYPLDNHEPTPKKWIVEDEKGNKVVRIPAGKLLVIGDNRNDSFDARFWGLLDRKRVHGKAMFIFWPLNRIRWVH